MLLYHFYVTQNNYPISMLVIIVNFYKDLVKMSICDCAIPMILINEFTVFKNEWYNWRKKTFNAILKIARSLNV